MKVEKNFLDEMPFELLDQTIFSIATENEIIDLLISDEFMRYQIDYIQKPNLLKEHIQLQEEKYKQIGYHFNDKVHSNPLATLLSRALEVNAYEQAVIVLYAKLAGCSSNTIIDSLIKAEIDDLKAIFLSLRARLAEALKRDNLDDVSEHDHREININTVYWHMSISCYANNDVSFIQIVDWSISYRDFKAVNLPYLLDESHQPITRQMSLKQIYLPLDEVSFTESAVEIDCNYVYTDDAEAVASQLSGNSNVNVPLYMALNLGREKVVPKILQTQNVPEEVCMEVLSLLNTNKPEILFKALKSILLHFPYTDYVKVSFFEEVICYCEQHDFPAILKFIEILEIYQDWWQAKDVDYFDHEADYLIPMREKMHDFKDDLTFDLLNHYAVKMNASFLLNELGKRKQLNYEKVANSSCEQHPKGLLETLESKALRMHSFLNQMVPTPQHPSVQEVEDENLQKLSKLSVPHR